MDEKAKLVMDLALDYMEILEEIAGEGYDEVVTDLINDVHKVITGTDQPLLSVSYKKLDVDEIEEMEKQGYETYENVGEGFKKAKDRSKHKEPERDFPNLTPELEEDIHTSLQHVYDVMQDISYTLEVSEEDRTALLEDNKKLRAKNENLLNQAKNLYKRNEYLDLHVKDLEDTIDDIFSKGYEEEKGEENDERD